MLMPPIEPMLATPLGSIVPRDDVDVAFEPKWDGFRALVFRTPAGVILQGRGRSRGSGDAYVDLAYAFPELVDQIEAHVPVGVVLDGEIVVEVDGRLDFEALSQRLRPRSEAGGTNIVRLSQELPAMLLAFDLLDDGDDLLALPFGDRRTRLTSLASAWPHPLHLTPHTTDAELAQQWFDGFESAGVDGIMVKPLDQPYAPGKRTQGKVKHRRTIDVVLAGWREHTKPGPDGAPMVGSLLLGLHDDDGTLHYIGGVSALSTAIRASLATDLAKAAVGVHPWLGSTTSRTPGAPNRWNKGKPWHAVAPERVLEVSYDQREGDRLRHAATFERWRPDRDPASCLLTQLEEPPAATIGALLSP